SDALVGTLSANIKGALEDTTRRFNDKELKGSDLAIVALSWIQHAVRTAANIKRECQFLIGRFIESLLLQNNFNEETDRALLNGICPAILKCKGIDDTDDIDEEDASEEDDVEPPEYGNFYLINSLILYLYSGNPPKRRAKEIKNNKIGVANEFIARAQALGLLGPSRGKSETRQTMQFTPASLLCSVSTQLSVELKLMYRNGSHEVCEKLKRLKNKGMLPKDADIDINTDLSGIENFVNLNKLDKNNRRIAPLPNMQLPFMTFSEGDLIDILWKNENLQAFCKHQVPSTEGYSLADFKSSLNYSNPIGSIVTALLSPVGRPINVRKGPRGLKDKTRVMTLNEASDHICVIRKEDFDPAKYSKSGYALTGTIRTDGFRLQLLSYKLKELKCVKFKRLPEEKLPNPLTSTVGGVDQYLTEIRNVVRSKDDVSTLWKCNPQKIKILGLDLGQACVVGASALLPVVNNKDNPQATKSIFHNLAVNQKAVYQPIFKLRRRLEYNKNAVTFGTKSISEIERDLPAVREDSASIIKYYEEFTQVKETLYSFYDGDKNIVKRHQWDARKARDNEYSRITNSLLKLVGGSIGQRRKKSNKVVIGIGLGQFLSRMRLSSLHETFLSYFVIKAYIHRDVMAGHNICNIVRGHLLEQQRPEYLQPVDENGNYPWKYKPNAHVEPLDQVAELLDQVYLLELLESLNLAGKLDQKNH
ncbi:hypothetical protein BGZ76_011867, partial [Entomortierella beljakovae]